MHTTLLETPAALHDVPTLETVLRAVFDAADYFGADDDQVTKTTFHLARKALTLKPGAQYKDLAPYLKRFCNKHEADTDKHLDELCYILIQGIKPFAPIIETAERLAANPWRETKLPDTIAPTPGYLALATACRYLREIANGGTFFLGCRKAGELIGESKSPAAKKLLVLRSAGVIKLVKEAYTESVTDDETGEQKLVRKAAEYKFTLDDNNQQRTQVPRVPRECNSPGIPTKPNQTQSDTDPELETIDQGLCRGTDWDEELHDDLETIQDDEHDPAMDTILEHAESSKGLVGKNAALFEEQPHPTSPLGTPDELIAMAVERKPGGVQGVLPKQESLPEPTATATATAALEEKIRATAPDPEGVPKSLDQALISLGQTFKAMETKQQTAPRIDEPTANCYRCKKPTTYQTPEGSEFDPERDAVVCKSCMDQSGETQSAKGVLPSERCRAELKENASKDKSLDDVKRGAAAILGKFLGENEAPDVKRIYDMILKYKSTAVIKATCKIINDPKKGSMGTTIGVLAWRLKEADLAVAV